MRLGWKIAEIATPRPTPNTPPNTGFLAFQDIRDKQEGFRIAASGITLELNKSVEVVKKLKLVDELNERLNT